MKKNSPEQLRVNEKVTLKRLNKDIISLLNAGAEQEVTP
jgi:hypothetical protein